VQLVFVETLGDQRTDVPLHTIGGQGVFVKEVQRAVLDGHADLAAHSAKDLPSAGARAAAGSVLRAPRRARRAGRAALTSCRTAPRLPPGRCADAPSSPRRARICSSSSCAATSTPACRSCRPAARW
jgi:hydroxymethylbilane synthase